jgi:hypothetical protein
MIKTEQELLELKKKFDAAKTRKDELTGQKKGLMEQLKKEWACASTQAGDIKIQGYLKQIKDIDTQIADNSEILETKYNL